MKFWDSSALIPLFIEQDDTKFHLSLLGEDPRVVAWWGSQVECASAFNRFLRKGLIEQIDFDQLLKRFNTLAASWIEIQPTNKLRQRAIRLLRVHPMHNADALQLAAALIASEENPQTLPFICSDLRLREAAAKEGFQVLP
jgi:predicted nucleic acid-binding protein